MARVTASAASAAPMARVTASAASPMTSCSPSSLSLVIGSTRAAARTSVLSHHWRHVWSGLPELHLGTCDVQPRATRLDSVDAALEACSAPAVQRLEVAMSCQCQGLRVHARRVAPWLRFASQRRVREIYILAPHQTEFFLATRPKKETLQLPLCATRITLSLERQWRLRLRPAGSFTSLTDLYIGRELGAFVSKQCPRLRNLYLSVRLVAACNVSISSNSLNSLSFDVKNTKKLEVIAPNPKLEVLEVCNATGAHICSPKLAEISWDGDSGYDPLCHSFANAGRHLRLLDLGSKCVVASLMHQFDKADVLKLNLNLRNFMWQGTKAYTRFLERNDCTTQV